MAKKLLVDPSLLNESDLSGPTEQVRPGKSRAELYEIFQKEIQEIIGRELLIKEKEVREKLQAEHGSNLKRMEREHSAKLVLLERRLEAVDALIVSLGEAQKKLIGSTLKDMDPVLVQMCMEILYKISGERICFEKVVDKALKAVTAMYLSGVRVKLFVSEEVFRLFAENYKESPIGECVSMDKSLRPGQIRIDDGTSITEAGLVEQLDNVRATLLSELRKAHAI